ncbi:hypothetical protein [Aromatoleum evansii]|uniref:Uncharacterized protein n=1 Tax=Aromatoleum evansii TaxID=59406 RepID=A0ABZ1AM09_AROEV|nr:hypothetical protein [Aromatoleum evansii]NMG30677.1 hypothetical protein [Aromatoleum evansii]WRL46889.1 hypothetical protein U5817_02215 [Aromatoleum evansii]
MAILPARGGGGRIVDALMRSTQGGGIRSGTDGERYTGRDGLRIRGADVRVRLSIPQPNTVRAEPFDFAQDRPVEALSMPFDKLRANGCI